MKTTVSLCVLAFVTLMGGSAADAQYSRFRGPALTGAEGTPVDDLPTPFSNGGSCVRMCDRDNTPCDPDYYKVADRRCNLNQKG